MIHLYKISKIGRPIKMENRLVVAWGKGYHNGRSQDKCGVTTDG